MGKSKLAIFISIGAFVISIISLLHSCQTSQRQFEISTEPQLKFDLEYNPARIKVTNIGRIPVTDSYFWTTEITTAGVRVNEKGGSYVNIRPIAYGRSEGKGPIFGTLNPGESKETAIDVENIKRGLKMEREAFKIKTAPLMFCCYELRCRRKTDMKEFVSGVIFFKVSPEGEVYQIARGETCNPFDLETIKQLVPFVYERWKTKLLER